MHRCPFCNEPKLRIRYSQEFHKVDGSFGPFDLGVCGTCGSLGTIEPPTEDQLSSFYKRYDEVRPEWYRAAAESGALDAQYHFYAKYILKNIKPGQSWADVGTGHGEVPNIVAEHRPTGIAIDIGPRPESLNADVGYYQADLNSENWTQEIGRFDLVFTVAVWEHVLQPAKFASQCLSLVSPGGKLVMITPDYGSLASNVLRRRWPYYEPGEHISIPTKRGAIDCLSRCATAANVPCNTAVHSLHVGYSVRYVLNVLRLNWLAYLVSPQVAAPLPTGILAAVVTRTD